MPGDAGDRESTPSDRGHDPRESDRQSSETNLEEPPETYPEKPVESNRENPTETSPEQPADTTPEQPLEANREHSAEANAENVTTTRPENAGVAATLAGILTGSVALIGATRPVRAETADPAAIATAVLAAFALGCFLAVRHGIGRRRHAAAGAAVASSLVALLAVYGLNREPVHALGLPPFAETPALLVALVAASLSVGAGVAAAAGLSTAGLRTRTVAAITFTGIGVIGFVAMTAWALVIGVIAVPTITGDLPTALSVPEQAVFSQVSTVLGVGTVAVGYLVWSGRGLSFIDLKWPTLRDIGWVVAGIIALVVVANLLAAILTTTGTESETHGSIDRAAENPELLLVLMVASVVVIGPFEELLYRNVIQKGLYEYFSRGGAVVVASVPFVLVHFSAYSGGHLGQTIVSLGLVFTLSLLLGAVYARTENLVVPALVHGLYNALVFYSAYLGLTG